MLLLADLGAVVVLGAGSVLSERGVITTGVVIAFLLYLDQFFSPIQQLSQVLDTWQQAAASVDQDRGAARHADRHARPRPTRSTRAGVRGEVHFDDVHFRYPNTAGAEALAGVDLDDRRRARRSRWSARPAPASRRSSS